ncbi:MAG: universal stress protein [Chloroflexi bacterium]|uniref:Universal stress protein n=1 Tax=Candidatus Chlorohelix allophototropha TaxID=3003348 RepID=A0A8T7LU63_9CHLR|nr:universal stress protein [Chloroflexota bacterium]WJW66279.1 universal stress protein [Chloroflexota bacterium L227-S17]
MIKRILLAYDGSLGSQIAAQHAAEIATHFNAEVTILTVGGPLFGGVSKDAPIAHMNEADYEKVADEGLAILADKKVRAHKRFRWIDPADEILHEALEGGYDLIVMGHRSAHSSIRRDEGMLGSVAIKVINHAPCSVMIVRPDSNLQHRSNIV